jgi:hypothetical protein
MVQILPSLCLTTNNHENAASIDFGVTNESSQVDQFAKVESVNNVD